MRNRSVEVLPVVFRLARELEVPCYFVIMLGMRRSVACQILAQSRYHAIVTLLVKHYPRAIFCILLVHTGAFGTVSFKCIPDLWLEAASSIKAILGSAHERGYDSPKQY